MLFTPFLPPLHLNVKVSRKDPEERAVLWDTTEELSYGRGKLREPKRPLGAWRHRFQRLLAHVAKSFRGGYQPL